MFLSVQIGSTFVDTSEADIPVVLNNPFLLDDGLVSGSFVFNFSVPLSSELKRELSFAHRPSIKLKPTWEHECSIRFGPLHYSGKATITQINNSNVEISLPVETGQLSSILEGITLHDLPIDEIIPFDPQITFADVVSRYDYTHSQQHVFVHDIFLKPDFVRIDTFTGWDPVANSFTAPAAGVYYINIVVNSSFAYADYLGSKIPMVGHRSFRVYNNGSYIFYANIDDPDNPQESNNSYLHTATYTLAEGDVLTFAIYASSRSLGILEYLLLSVNPGTIISIDDNTTPFDSIPSTFYPDSKFAVFPFHNSLVFDHLPDSLYNLDINDLKEDIPLLSPIVNNYRDAGFPYVLKGSKNNVYYAFLNLFSASPYLAYVINKLFEKIDFSISNNVFESDLLKYICILSPRFINNYFDSGPFQLKSFIPDANASEFLVNICKLLGIAFTVDHSRGEITFKRLKDIINDTSSIEFSDNVIGHPELTPELFNGYSFKTKPTSCKYISSYFKSLEGLNIKGSFNSYSVLPQTGNEIKDCYYVSYWRAWFVWQYDPEEGGLNWVFHSIDHNLEDTVTDPDSSHEPFEINTQVSAAANYLWNKIAPLKDMSIGSVIRYWKIPGFHLPGNFKSLPEAYKSDDEFALVCYWGLQRDNQTLLYPFASNDVFNYQNDKIAHADLSLLPEGEYGLYEVLLKDFIQWRLSSPGVYTAYKFITPLALTKINYFKWYKVRGVDYIIKSIHFNIKYDRISPCQLELLKR